jgi:hypothetical protein
MAIASYEVVGSGGVWRVKHDGEPVGSYQTKESAFEAAVAAASLAVREGYEVQLFSTQDSHRILTGTVKPSVRRASPGRRPDRRRPSCPHIRGTHPS